MLFILFLRVSCDFLPAQEWESNFASAGCRSIRLAISSRIWLKTISASSVLIWLKPLQRHQTKAVAEASSLVVVRWVCLRHRSLCTRCRFSSLSAGCCCRRLFEISPWPRSMSPAAPLFRGRGHPNTGTVLIMVNSHRSKLVKNWSKLVKISQKLVKIEQNWTKFDLCELVKKFNKIV